MLIASNEIETLHNEACRLNLALFDVFKLHIFKINSRLFVIFLIANVFNCKIVTTVAMNERNIKNRLTLDGLNF